MPHHSTVFHQEMTEEAGNNYFWYPGCGSDHCLRPALTASYISTSMIPSVPFAVASFLVDPSSSFFPDSSVSVLFALSGEVDDNCILTFFPRCGLHLMV